ncbi:hypothetical protein INR49_000807 [Caranx melampygus]|nr:hypothetical protein INR49_000807 [Caranx melampygus]
MSGCYRRVPRRNNTKEVHLFVSDGPQLSLPPPFVDHSPREAAGETPQAAVFGWSSGPEMTEGSSKQVAICFGCSTCRSLQPSPPFPDENLSHAHRKKTTTERMSLLQGVLSWASIWHVLNMLGTGLAAMVAFFIARLLVRHAWYTHRLSCFSKPPADSWLMGHLGQMKSSEEGLLQVDDLVQTFKHSCSWFLGPFYHLVRVFHPDYVKPLLMAPASITVKDELIYDHLRPWLGQSLLLSNGELQQQLSGVRTPALPFDTLRVNLSTSEYVSAIVELSDLIMDRRLRILHHWDWIYWKTQQGKQFKKALSVIHRFTREVVQKRRALINQQRETGADFTKAPQRKKDFVDIILLSKDVDGQGLTDEEILAEANTFMFAGHDTTASAVCWTLYNLARHADHQEKCRQEVMDLMQGRDGQEIEWEDLAHLTYTTMCIRESLRLHSPVQAVTRKYTQDMTLPGDRTVPQGTICLVSIYGTHHNPAVWTNPNEFDPLRFDPTSKENHSSHAFIPFSSGPRNCIGQKFALAELRVVVALTLLRFRLTPGVNPELGSSSGGVRRLPQLVLRAEGGLWLQLEPLATPDTEDPLED